VEGAVKDLLPAMEGALKELPEELLLPKEAEVEGLLTLPEGGLKDLPLLVEGALEGPSKPLC
jgi:hypothetical protein